MIACKYYRRNENGNGTCALLDHPIDRTFIEIRTVFKEHCKDREMVPNGECFWKHDEFMLCPKYTPETNKCK